ncbi:sensor histidine kinase [Arsenicicoccus piscis]|uniref:histidine kinase n=1 Tax=Arsenicicoccus piscis TaxID=673954 RepID=A0ABQ6HSA3_9MICO|nr:sensor histidine kinase [Arsenicicoccus piscis]MCH8626588.1 sensor histidine kinase [Arsenicicoccus piscis]GMA21237.1 two-component sensor histidine kinase [Arsenicicoccus piscis]
MPDHATATSDRPGGGLAGVITRFFALDDSWVRPRPPLSRADVLTGLVAFLVGAIGLELVRSFADMEGARPAAVQYLALVAGTLPLVWRRRFPIEVAAIAGVLFFVSGVYVPEVVYLFAYQITYFFALFSGVAWARNRRLMVLILGGVMVLMFGWLCWDFAMGSAIEDILRHNGTLHGGQGLLPPAFAAVANTYLINVIYFGGALVLGQASWREARSRARLEVQAEQLAEQAETLQEQAVVQERLRIARELHDVVAHHVSVMGVQAAAARRVLGKDPALASEALANVESSSRQAVGEMRGLLGTLRGGIRPTKAEAAQAEQEQPSRDPEPTVADLPRLVESYAGQGFSASLAVVEDEPGAATQLPMPVSLSLYRTAQEALTNVRRHSTARSASVVLRIGRDQSGPRYAEIEVLDDGRPRTGTSGSGLGLLGMRERIASHGGTSEIGPRLTGGYRVRVRFPAQAA